MFRASMWMRRRRRMANGKNSLAFDHDEGEKDDVIKKCDKQVRNLMSYKLREREREKSTGCLHL